MKTSCRMLRLLAFLLLSMAVAGCAGEPDSADEAEVIAARETFRQGVESYDLDLMTGHLAEGFTLTLKEGQLQYTKDRARLCDELEQDEDLQLYWRNQYNYRLALNFNNFGHGFYDGAHATAHARFTVIESATGIPETVTDTGLIEMNLIQLGDTWRIADMTITFDTAQSQTLRSAGAFPMNAFFGRPGR